MPKYINVDKQLEKLPNDLPYKASVKRVLIQAPAEDVVEVVRCKDCKHGRPVDKNKSPEKYFKSDCIVCECEDVVGEDGMIYLPTHFCSYGEKK